ncbi:MAG: hypothetical protein M1819_006630 [Sarea resinae]|nr:MAG: hypothetical protein M1819_006630 [Sarea resinae]
MDSTRELLEMEKPASQENEAQVEKAEKGDKEEDGEGGRGPERDHDDQEVDEEKREKGRERFLPNEEADPNHQDRLASPKANSPEAAPGDECDDSFDLSSMGSAERNETPDPSFWRAAAPEDETLRSSGHEGDSHLSADSNEWQNASGWSDIDRDIQGAQAPTLGVPDNMDVDMGNVKNTPHECGSDEMEGVVPTLATEPIQEPNVAGTPEDTMDWLDKDDLEKKRRHSALVGESWGSFIKEDPPVSANDTGEEARSNRFSRPQSRAMLHPRDRSESRRTTGSGLSHDDEIERDEEMGSVFAPFGERGGQTETTQKSVSREDDEATASIAKVLEGLALSDEEPATPTTTSQAQAQAHQSAEVHVDGSGIAQGQTGPAMASETAAREAPREVQAHVPAPVPLPLHVPQPLTSYQQTSRISPEPFPIRSPHHHPHRLTETNLSQRPEDYDAILTPKYRTSEYLSSTFPKKVTSSSEESPRTDNHGIEVGEQSIGPRKSTTPPSRAPRRRATPAPSIPSRRGTPALSHVSSRSILSIAGARKQGREEEGARRDKLEREYRETMEKDSQDKDREFEAKLSSWKDAADREKQTLSDEAGMLQDLLDKKEEELTEKNAQIRKLRGEVVQLKGNADRAEDEVKRLANKIDVLKEEFTSEKEKTHDLEQEFYRTREELTNIQEQVSAYRSQAASSALEKASLDRLLTQSQERIQSMEDEHLARLDLEAQLESKDNLVERLEKQVDQLEAEASDWKSKSLRRKRLNPDWARQIYRAPDDSGEESPNEPKSSKRFEQTRNEQNLEDELAGFSGQSSGESEDDTRADSETGPPSAQSAKGKTRPNSMKSIPDIMLEEAYAMLHQDDPTGKKERRNKMTAKERDGTDSASGKFSERSKETARTEWPELKAETSLESLRHSVMSPEPETALSQVFQNESADAKNEKSDINHEIEEKPTGELESGTGAGILPKVVQQEKPDNSTSTNEEQPGNAETAFGDIVDATQVTQIKDKTDDGKLATSADLQAPEDAPATVESSISSETAKNGQSSGSVVEAVSEHPTEAVVEVVLESSTNHAPTSHENDELRRQEILLNKMYTPFRWCMKSYVEFFIAISQPSSSPLDSYSEFLGSFMYSFTRSSRASRAGQNTTSASAPQPRSRFLIMYHALMFILHQFLILAILAYVLYHISFTVKERHMWLEANDLTRQNLIIERSRLKQYTPIMTNLGWEDGGLVGWLFGEEASRMVAQLQFQVERWLSIDRSLLG